MLNRGFACLLALSACGDSGGSGTGASSSPLGDGGVVRRDGGVSSAGGGCTAGKKSTCYCPDGKQSGSQTCSSKGVLGECQCQLQDTSRPVAGGDAPLCPDLVNQSSCQATPYVSKELPTSMLFVLDRSRSMVCNLPPLQSSEDCEANPQALDRKQPSKWRITRESLSSTFEELPGGALLGLAYFSNNGDCGVNSEPAVDLKALDDAQRSALVDSLNTVQPDGLTPIVGSTILAYNHLHEEIKAPGNRYVVLITDGAESCNPESIGQLLDTEVKKARDANIRTFVIGAPGSEQARALLSELAYRGGTAVAPNCTHNINGAADVGDCHLDMTKSTDFAAALAAALGTVSTAAQGCEFAVPPNNGLSGKEDVNVQYSAGGSASPECFSQVDGDCETANGWQFAKGSDGAIDYGKVVLCGSACDAIRKDPAARVDILVGCKPIVVI
jgi:von Willebrand factor type A domain